MAGYLKTPRKEIQADGAYLCEVSISNREISGRYYGIEMEEWIGEAELEKFSLDALNQIDEKRYDLELKEEGIENVIKLGIAFSGKKVVIKTNRHQSPLNHG